MPKLPVDAPPDSPTVRSRIVDALRLDLVGPSANADADAAHELLPTRPSAWYLLGFLIPAATKLEDASDDDEDEELDAVPENAGLPEESAEERRAARKGLFPSSMGLSFLVPASTATIDVTVRWGDYQRIARGADGKSSAAWRRTPRAVCVPVPLRGAAQADHPIPESQGLTLHVVERTLGAAQAHPRIAPGTRSVSLFLVNRRRPRAEHMDEAFAFQAELEVCCADGFVARPDLSGLHSTTWDERVADMHFADAPEFAAGHGVSAEWDLVDGACHTLRTAWMPSAQVERTVTAAVPQVELSMQALGALADGAQARAALQPLVEAYRAWIDAQAAQAAPLSGDRAETAESLLQNARFAAMRIERGIELLASDADALDAFRVANRAVARAIAVRLKIEAPRWRAFQLAFLLLNLRGLADPQEPERDVVDLLFFPTGGGKTEAYLGLAAFAMVLRRLRHPAEGARGGAGVSVVMRYTLRLLTLDQLGRAAGLVCALELEREQNAARYGDWPFELGLWVGKAATPNRMGAKGDGRDDTARVKVRHYKESSGKTEAPIPIESCPWCNTPFTPASFSLTPNADKPSELRLTCANFECEFSGKRTLPIVAVDEPLYRRLPAFLIATVDKFASLPWTGYAGLLLGGADRFDNNGFYGPLDAKTGRKLAAPLPPPDLIIQDELHLISGPLGTMAGLYEAAVAGLCARDVGGRIVRPKIVASTATVRSAGEQIAALFARSATQIFPPPGVTRRDSFFAQMLSASETPARLYLGIVAPGRNPKQLMRRVWLALLCAAAAQYDAAGGTRAPNNPADPYMTVLGYFNSLRELGGARRILEEEVQSTARGYGARRRLEPDAGDFADRRRFSEVMELTSRETTAAVAQARKRLEAMFADARHVDCAIATNMISVGLDIQRLGLMVVNGQPRLHAEYIQATSRVGRDEKRPGLVVTLLNMHKPRDRSHYERFRHYHETFYRAVEASSVTPFAARALDRGLAGAMVGLARHAERALTPPAGAESIAAVRSTLEHTLIDAFVARIDAQTFDDEQERRERVASVRTRIVDLLDSWATLAERQTEVGARLQYQNHDMVGDAKLPKTQVLLQDMLEPLQDPHEIKFRANRSLRDVEPSVNLFLKDLFGKPVEE